MESLNRPVAPLDLFSRTVLGLVKSNHPDLTLRQMAALLVVYNNTGDAYNISDVAHRLLISKPAACRILDRLEELRFIKREPSLLDRRKILVLRAEECPNFIDFIEDLLGVDDDSKSHKSGGQATLPPPGRSRRTRP